MSRKTAALRQGAGVRLASLLFAILIQLPFAATARADVYFIETGTLSSYASSTNPAASNPIGQPFTLTIDFQPFLDQDLSLASHCASGEPGTCYVKTVTAATQNLTTLSFPTLGISGTRQSGGFEMLNLQSPVAGGYGILTTESGAMPDTISLIQSASAPLPDPFATPNAYFSAPVSGILQAGWGPYPPSLSSLAPSMQGSWTGSVTYLTITTVAPVPEPRTYAMMLAGMALLGAAAWRRQNGGFDS